MEPEMLQIRHSVAFFYRIRLTSLRFLHSLPSNKAARMVDLLSRRVVKWGAVAGMVLVAAGCATIDSRPAPEVVKERAQARANAIVAVDMKAAYGYFTPTARKDLTYEAFAAKMVPGFWKVATVDQVECKREDLCYASLIVEYEYRGHRLRTPLRESWIREGNEWWYAVKE
jgi:hypothetical protein